MGFTSDVARRVRRGEKVVSFLTNNRYDPVTGCWNWTGAKDRWGYGMMGYMGRLVMTHRLSAHFYLRLPNGDHFHLKSKLHVLHHCDNPACFNPKHLFFGTNSDNAKDCSAKRRHFNTKKTTCPQGHPYSGVNYKGSRVCNICGRIAQRKYSERIKNERLQINSN